MAGIDESTKQLLEKMEFKPSESDAKDYYHEIDGGKAHVDFRKVDGRRWARINGEFVKENELDEKVPILKQFKEEREKLKNSQSSSTEQAKRTSNIEPLQSSGKLDIQREATSPKLGTHDTKVEGKSFLEPHTTIPSPPTPNDAQPEQKPPIVPVSQLKKNIFLHEIALAYDIDICEIFGESGAGKSQLSKQIALDAISEGKKVMYIDTERGFRKSDIKKLIGSYQYISSLKDVLTLVQKIPNDVDVFILDSVGYPVLTEWAKLGVNERGNALTQIIAIKDYIKDWAINNGKIAIVINQPDSNFGKDKDYENRPFGDKGQFVIKEVFQIERSRSSTTDRTISVLKSYRSRFEGRGTIVAQIEITGDGIKII